MELSKSEKLIAGLLINVQTEILCLKDFVLANLAGGLDNKEKMDYLISLYEDTKKMYQEDVLVQIKNRFDDKLGSIDDLLNSL